MTYLNFYSLEDISVTVCLKLEWWKGNNYFGLPSCGFLEQISDNLGRSTFNSLWYSDAKWHHKIWSTLVEVMACCLMAPNHYLNQRWLITNEVLLHSPEDNFTLNVIYIYPWYELQNWFKTTAGSHRGHWGNVNPGLICHPSSRFGDCHIFKDSPLKLILWSTEEYEYAMHWINKNSF